MNKIVILVIVLFMLASCKSEQKKETKKKPIKKVESKYIKVGWVNEDTYTVKVFGSDINNAKKNAKLKILKDIVKTRTLNNSPYLNVAGINDEFKKPLKQGKIIKELKISNGIEIHYQIKHKGLKKMFRRN